MKTFITFIAGMFAGFGQRLHAALFGYMVRTGAIACAAPMRSTDFRPIVEPILNKFFDGIYEQRKDEYKAVFDVIKAPFPRKYFEEPVGYGFGAAPMLPDGMPVSYQQGGVLFTQRYNYLVYGLAFALTKVLMDDGDHIAIGSTFSKHLAQSLIETKETLAANILNRAFNGSYVGGDGVCLNSASHPYNGGTYSNVLATAAALSQTSLEQILVQIRKAVDNSGKKVKVSAQRLVCGPDNVYQSEVLLKSVLRAGTSNNDMNPVKSKGELEGDAAILSRITSTTAWWVKTDVPEGGKCIIRTPLAKSMEGDFETDSVRYKATERYAISWTDPRFLFGTAGA